MKTQHKWLVMLTVTLTIVLAACGQQGKQSSPNSSKQQVWHRMESDVLQTLDPSKASEGVSGQAIIDTMNGLYKYYGHKLQPAMATKIVKPTNNGLTYTLRYAMLSGVTAPGSRHRISFSPGSGRSTRPLSHPMPICIPGSRMLTTSALVKNRPRPLASKQSTARRWKSRWNIRFPISTAC